MGQFLVERQFGLVATRKLILLMFAVMLAISVGLVSVVVYSARVMDRASIDNQKLLIDNALTSRITRSLSELRSVAWWDEAVEKTSSEGFDREWIELEMGVFMTESYGHSRVIILDENDRPVYLFANKEAPRQASVLHDLRAMRALIRQVRGGPNVSPRVKDINFTSGSLENTAFSQRRYARGAAAVLKLGDKAAIATVMAITPSVDLSLRRDVPRLLVTIINVDDAFLNATGTSLLMPELGFSRPENPDYAQLTLKSDAGAPIGTVYWHAKRPGRLLMDNVLPTILIGLALSVALLGELARRLTKASQTLVQREALARHMANHDILTGLPNRRLLMVEIEKAIDECARDGTKVMLATLDLDRFKEVNDTLGHHSGDELLCQVARRLEQTMPANDLVARLGGDEFAVMRIAHPLTRETDFGEQLLSAFRQPIKVGGHPIDLNSSIGIASGASAGEIRNLMQSSDIALYDAKARLVSQVAYFVPRMATAFEERHRMKSALREGIGRGELRLQYQPIVEASTGRVTAVEALIRWESPEFGPVSPMTFLPLAEECGLMPVLGQFVIDRAMEDSRRWPDIAVSINVSPGQLRSVSIVSEITRAARRHGVDPSKCIIEVTETALLGNDKRTVKKLHMLKERGFNLALDDFGTGYSSLAYIRDFPFDRLKIDKSFTSQFDDQGRGLDIIEGIVNFGKILGRDVIAEGIETEMQMQAMQRCGVTHLQGYLFSRAVDADRIDMIVAAGGVIPAQRTASGNARSDDADDGKNITPPGPQQSQPRVRGI